jgi:hypothetical protein
MKKLQMLFLLGVTLLLGAAPLLAQNSVDVLGGGPQPANTTGCAVNPNCIPATWSTTSNAGSDITTAITNNFVFAANGGESATDFPSATSGKICLADTRDRTMTTLFAQIAANCQAAGGVALLLVYDGGVNAPAAIPVFTISTANGDFLRNTVGCGSPTSMPCTATNNVSTYPIRINPTNPTLTFNGGGPTGQHNCPNGQTRQPFVGAGTANFTPNESLCLPAAAGQGAEPSMIVDSQGTIYVESIRGVPGGLDLWRWNQTADGGPNANGTLPFKYEGQPDCGIFLTPFCMMSGLAPGGGDGDVATNAPDPSNPDTFNVDIPNLAVVSLTAAEVTASHSTDRADSFSLPNGAAAQVPGDDRMWIDAFDDAGTVYMNFHDAAAANIHVQRSTNGGFTYNAGAGEAIDPTNTNVYPATGTSNTAGQIKVDHNTNSCPTKGNLYQVFTGPSTVQGNIGTNSIQDAVYVGVSTDAKTIVSGMPNPAFTFKDYKIFTSPTGSPGATNGNNQVFPALATDNNGFVYAVWSDNTNIYFASSVGASQGSAWNPAVRVNQVPTVGNANLFPWVAADANGHAVVAWLGADKPGNSNNTTAMNGAQWNVYAAETVNGNTTDPLGPTFMQYTASDHVIHTGTVSTGGFNPTGSASRSLADFFQVALDPHHHANIAYTDDHASSSGVPYFTRQKSSSAGGIQSATEGSCFIPVNKICSGGGGGDAEGEGDERGDDGHDGHFKMTAMGGCKPSGDMEFDEPDTGEGMYGHADDVSVSGNTAVITGSCTLLNGTACRYAAIVVGNGNPAIGTDLFTISWTAADGSFFHTSGILTAGNITVHP